MATGDKQFSTKGRQAKKSVRRLCPIGMYELKMKTDRAEVKQAKSGRSRITGIAFEALNSGGDSGKNYFVYHDFHLGLEEGNDGVIMVDRANQIVGFARAAGTELKGCDVVTITATPDPKDPATTQKEKALNAMQVLKWLKALDGTVVRGQVKHETRTGDGAQLDDEGKPMRDARVAYFEAPKGDESDEESEDEEDDEDEESEEGEDEDEEGEDEGDEDEDEDEDEEEKPAPKKPKKKSKK